MRVDLGSVSIRNLRLARWVEATTLLALWLAGGLGLAWGLRTEDSLASCVSPLALFGGTVLLLSWRPGRSLAGEQRAGVQGALSVEEGAIEVERGGRTLRLARRDMVAGWIEPGTATAGDAVVLLTRSGLEVRLVPREAAECQAILRAAGVDADQRAVKIRVRPGDGWAVRLILMVSLMWMAPFLLLSLAGIGLALFRLFFRPVETGGTELATALACAVGALVSGGSVWVLLQRLATTTFTIGTDGIAVEHLFRRTMLPRASVQAVTADEGNVVVRLTGGGTVDIFSSQGAAVTVASRIQAALQVTADAPSAPLERLDRRGRSAREWLDDLRTLARDGQGYRDLSFDRRDLLSVVKDGAAPAERRVAAAAALSTRRDEDDRAALRVAADTCADDRLRVVLDRAAEAELDAEELDAAVTGSSPARRA